MQADPIGEVRGLYGWLGEPVTAEFATRMREWWAATTRITSPADIADPARSGCARTRSDRASAEYIVRMEKWT